MDKDDDGPFHIVTQFFSDGKVHWNAEKWYACDGNAVVFVVQPVLLSASILARPSPLPCPCF